MSQPRALCLLAAFAAEKRRLTPQLLVVVFVVILVEKRRTFDKDYDKDYDEDSASQIRSRSALLKRLWPCLLDREHNV